MKANRHKITFETETDSLAAAMGKAGLGNYFIRLSTGLRDHQISYRLSKLKRVEKARKGYRRAWSDGTSWAYRRYGVDLIAVLRADILATVPQKIVHLVPKISSTG